jgi:hypothetical protein
MPCAALLFHNLQARLFVPGWSLGAGGINCPPACATAQLPVHRGAQLEWMALPGIHIVLNPPTRPDVC